MGELMAFVMEVFVSVAVIAPPTFVQVFKVAPALVLPIT